MLEYCDLIAAALAAFVFGALVTNVLLSSVLKKKDPYGRR